MMTPEQRKAYNKEYYLANKERTKERLKAWRSANPELRREQGKRDWENNKETRKISQKLWNQANKDLVRTLRRNRKTLVRNAAYDGWRDSDVWIRDESLCQICFEEVPADLSVTDYTNPLYPNIDHIIGLAYGGSNLFENVRLTHLKCNLRRTNEEERQGI
jgi:5-methylcytosine-specific restriction endonuclease McrA